MISVVEPSGGAEVESKLAETAGQLGNPTTWRIVESGGPTDAVLITELPAGRKEVWCVGLHARGAFSELFINSLSENFVCEAHLAVVLVVPRSTAALTGRVLAVALDGTKLSEDILPAADLAHALGMTRRLSGAPARAGGRR